MHKYVKIKFKLNIMQFKKRQTQPQKKLHNLILLVKDPF